MLYFFFAYKQIVHLKEVVFSVPSGNFGNICAGIVAKKLGLPIKHFIASTNANDTVPKYLKYGNYVPKASKTTISNAMDVGNPSNFIRIQELFDNDLETIKKHVSSFSFSDNSTRKTMKDIYKKTSYITDPHGAVGYLGLKKYGLSENEIGIFLETAHPVKFLDIVEETLDVKVEIPPQIQKVIDKEKVTTQISSYNELNNF